MAGSRRLNELQALIREQAPDPLPSRAVVALSGGADSAVAAHLMLDLGVPCRALHVDHGLPGSAAMRTAADAIAQVLDVDLEVSAVTVPSGPSPEDQARTARYAALERRLVEDEWLVTGHTLDDQAETVLLHLLRGAGLDGLGGIPQRRGRILRPLLAVTRAQTRELATLLGIPWRDDPSNEDLDLRRNELRCVVMPDLERRFNPRLREALARLAETVSAERHEASREVQMRPVAGGVALSTPELHAYGPTVAAGAVRRALRSVRGPHAGTRAEVVRALEVAAGVRASTQIEGGVDVVREGPWLVFVGSEDGSWQADREWAVPGEVSFGSWALDAWLSDHPPPAFPLSAWTAVTDADTFPEQTTIRTARPEDEIDGIPVGEVLRRLGVPPRARSSWPVVASAAGILWVPGGRISRVVWVGSATRRYLWVHAALETV
jgi:tRNA(Ile)-lysidine synthase